ncbi:MAG: succinate dehydrogenase/fumarate reductase iron-sulfur subunit, partial [Alphaproteobacteria bacterium]|nr:succinate dehydrogenase/fumarate reductase iron-sulfur subunit [Alphaproteobacteria bacterium]
MREMLAVSIWRGGDEGEFVAYDVPRRENQTVLDVVTYIQRRLDSGLSYRFACRVGMCGSCAMTVNGRARWTCRTHVSGVTEDGRLEIAPLRNLPIIKDVTVDMQGFFDKWAKAGGAFQPTQTRADDFAAISPSDPERAQANAGIEC